VVIAAFFWVLWYKNLQMVLAIEGLQSFDPFDILGVSTEATIKEIKKAYRRLSLEMHPDKNPDNPLAVQEFIRLTKAYNVSIHQSITNQTCNRC
jgi:translocation protein SEC63